VGAVFQGLHGGWEVLRGLREWGFSG